MRRKQRELAYLLVLAIVIMFVVVPVTTTGNATFDDWWDDLFGPKDEPPTVEEIETEYTCNTLSYWRCSEGTCPEGEICAFAVDDLNIDCRCVKDPESGTPEPAGTPCSQRPSPRCGSGDCPFGYRCGVNEYEECGCEPCGTIPISCKDTESIEKNVDKFGSVSGLLQDCTGKIQNYKYNDFCRSPTSLIEYTCNSNQIEFEVFKYNCLGGCANGACQNACGILGNKCIDGSTKGRCATVTTREHWCSLNCNLWHRPSACV